MSSLEDQAASMERENGDRVQHAVPLQAENERKENWIHPGGIMGASEGCSSLPSPILLGGLGSSFSLHQPVLLSIQWEDGLSISQSSHAISRRLQFKGQDQLMDWVPGCRRPSADGLCPPGCSVVVVGSWAGVEGKTLQISLMNARNRESTGLQGHQGGRPDSVLGQQVLS